MIRSKINIVVVDDDELILNMMQLFFETENCLNVNYFNSGNEGLNYINSNTVELIYLDLNLKDINGAEILKKISTENPQIPIIIITGDNNIETAVSIMKTGAYDFLVKPMQLQRLSVSLQNVLKYIELNSSFTNLKKEFFYNDKKNKDSFSFIKTNNSSMIKLFHYCKAISSSSFPVLITGETGVGKELFAKSLHTTSNSKGKFIAVDVSSYDATTFKDALFGHIKGSYTGAINDREGLIKKAAFGTLFLDEIGDLSLELQNILLRVIQENEYRQNGSDKILKTNVRYIFATNKDLPSLILEGKFRKDLYYRLETHSFNIPPLRERLDDVSLLFKYFVNETSTDLNIKIDEISQNVISNLNSYDFPGNVRELKNIAVNAVVLAENNKITLKQIENKINVQKKYNIEEISKIIINESFPSFIEAEEILIDEAMKRTNNNQSNASKLLGISRQALNKRLNKRYN